MYYCLYLYSFTLQFISQSEELTLQKDEAVQGLRRELDERAGTDNGTIERMHGTITSLENRITQLVQDETKYRLELYLVTSPRRLLKVETSHFRDLQV